MAITDCADFECYLEQVPAYRKSRIRDLHQLITSVCAEVDVSMKYRMPTYASGSGWVAIASQKYYISLYTCSHKHIERYGGKYPEIRTGTGCLNFNDSDSLHEEDLQSVIRNALKMRDSTGHILKCDCTLSQQPQVLPGSGNEMAEPIRLSHFYYFNDVKKSMMSVGSGLTV